MKKCPFCAEEIQDAAIVCKHCRRDLGALVPAVVPVAPQAPPVPTKSNSSAFGQVALATLFTLIFVAVLFYIGDSNAPPRVAPPSAPSEPGAIPSAQSAPESRLTSAQRNAARSAQSYLNVSGFSRRGLIDQLSSEYGNQFGVGDATVAVDSLNVDWNAQAARSAAAYLKISGFSCRGLIEQLSSEYGNKNTVEQATYGARQVGAC